MAAEALIPPAFLSTRAYLASLKPGDVPEACPRCGSDDIVPCFPGPEWECCAEGCGQVFEVER
jgi:hypothetical protein